MKKDIDSRVLLEAQLILESKGTVRSVAKLQNISKSTVHYDLSYRLKKINLTLYKKVNNLLKFNLSERHIRGGQATKNKYIKCNKKMYKIIV